MTGNQPITFNSIVRKANKEHKCCECDRTIENGENYRHTSGVWDGEPESYNQCLNCYHIMDVVSREGEFDESPCFGFLRKHILEDFHEPAKEFLTEISKWLGVSESNLNQLLKLNHIESCGMQEGTLECRGDGYLWDADYDGYDPEDKSMPCPQCNTLVYLMEAKHAAENTSYYSDMTSSGSGITIWESAVKTAKFWNKENTEVSLKAIGLVKAIYDNPDNKEEVLIKDFNY